MQDFSKADYVDITYDRYGTLWVNVDGKCVLRVRRVEGVKYNSPRMLDVEVPLLKTDG